MKVKSEREVAHSHVETEAPSEVLRLLRFRPMALILHLHSPTVNRDSSSGNRRVMALFLAAVGEDTMGIKGGQRGTFLMSSGKRWTWWSSG